MLSPALVCPQTALGPGGLSLAQVVEGVRPPRDEPAQRLCRQGPLSVAQR